jgi:hypothetical protein
MSRASPLSLSAFSASFVQSSNWSASKAELSSSNGPFVDSTPSEAALSFLNNVFTVIQSKYRLVDLQLNLDLTYLFLLASSSSSLSYGHHRALDGGPKSLILRKVRFY